MAGLWEWESSTGHHHWSARWEGYQKNSALSQIMEWSKGAAGQVTMVRRTDGSRQLLTDAINNAAVAEAPERLRR